MYDVIVYNQFKVVWNSTSGGDGVDFAARFRLLRSERALSQLEIANILGSKPTTVASWEQGRSRPEIDMLVKIANYFNVSVDYLLGLTDIKQPVAKYYYTGKDFREKELAKVTESYDFDQDDFIKFKDIMAAEQITPELLKKLLPIIRVLKNTLHEPERR